MKVAAGAHDTSSPVVLFDGLCNLCNAWVDFVLRHDGGAGIRFAALQSEVAKRILEDNGCPEVPGDTVVLLDDAGVWTESGAALRILRMLRFPYRLLHALVVVPRPIRDRGYRWVARHRYRWFGKRDVCRVPTPDERERFLER